MEMNLADGAVVNKVLNMKAKEDWTWFTGVPEDKMDAALDWRTVDNSALASQVKGRDFLC